MDAASDAPDAAVDAAMDSAMDAMEVAESYLDIARQARDDEQYLVLYAEMLRFREHLRWQHKLADLVFNGAIQTVPIRKKYFCLFC